MNLFEANKVAGAILMSLLIIVVIGHIGDILVPIPKVAHDAAMATHGESGGAQHAAAPAAAEKPIADLLKTANVDEGAKVFKKCQTCHTGEKGGANKVGPNLWNIVGDKKAEVAGFAFSDAMKNSPGDWTYDSLNQFLMKPSAYIAGTKMTFPGIRDPQERADVIAYLRTLSDSPKPLP